jgi:hypothetical protein
MTHCGETAEENSGHSDTVATDGTLSSHTRLNQDITVSVDSQRLSGQTLYTVISLRITVREFR